MVIAVITALMISVFNALSAIIIGKIALKKDANKFNKMIFGSMAIRYFLTIILVWICLKYFRLEQLPFALTFLISTFILLILEILYLNFRSNLLILQSNTKKME